MWHIVHASFWKFRKFSNSGISLNWSITDEVTTRNTTAYFWPTLYVLDRLAASISLRHNMNLSPQHL